MERNLSTVSLIQSSNEMSTRGASVISDRSTLTTHLANEVELTSNTQLLLGLASVQFEHLALGGFTRVTLGQAFLELGVRLADGIDDGLVVETSVTDEVPLVLALDGALEMGFGDVTDVGKLCRSDEHTRPSVRSRGRRRC